MTASSGRAERSWGTSRALNELAAATADTFTLRYEVRPPIAHTGALRPYSWHQGCVSGQRGSLPGSRCGVPAAAGTGQIPQAAAPSRRTTRSRNTQRREPGVPVADGSPESTAGIPLRKTCANSFMAMADGSSRPGTGAAPAVEV